MNPELEERLKSSWYSPSQCLAFYPFRVKWMLYYYSSCLSQGFWPPKGGGGCEVRSGQPHAPHELVSGIAGELMLRLGKTGKAGLALFDVYVYQKPERAVAKQMGWTEWGMKREFTKALRAIMLNTPIYEE